MPVDYTQPDGEQVDIAVARLRATEPDQRLGSLVFNFGGPGDAGTETLPGYAAQIPAAVRARYDLVSFDPRGTGKSRPVECIDDATADRLNAVDPTPNSDADLHAFYDGTNDPVDVVARCVARNGAWLAQLGSRNVARDLDRLRTALGEDTLSFVGYSYGTVIGSVYAQMFPDRVGRMVLDSPVDLSADALDGAAGQLAGLRAGARRLPRRLREAHPPARSTAAATRRAALATPRTPLRAGPRAADRRPRHGRRTRSGRPASPRSTPR